MVRTVVDAADFVVVPSWRRITSSRRRCFCLRVAGELGFHYIAVELALLSVQRNRVAPRSRSARGKCLDRHRGAQWMRVRIKALPCPSRYYSRSTPAGFRVRPRFDSRSEPLWKPERHGARLPLGSLLTYFSQLIPRVSLLVLLLVSAAIGDENCFLFKWLWY